MIRLGIIADTHYPTRIPTLPYQAIEDAFRSVDAILHAGDIETQEALDHLSGIAPVLAVKGDDDHFDLPLKRVLEFEELRIGLTHGHSMPLAEEFYRLRRRLGFSGHQELLGRIPGLLRRFEGDHIHMLIFGHSHMPMHSQREGVILYNPGAVYTMTLDSALWQLRRERNPVRRRMLLRHIRRCQNNPDWCLPRSTVGILEIHAGSLRSARFIDLPVVDHHLV